MMKKWWIFISLMSVMMLAACGGTEEKKETATDKEKLTVMLDWYPNAVHSALYVAQEKGYFEEQGLDVEIQMPADTNDPIKLAATGKVDLALTYQSQMVLSRAEGIPVVSVAAYVRSSLDSIMVKKESGIVSPKDLVGKSVGYPSTTVSEAVVKTMVETDGGDYSKVQMTDVGWDLMPSLATGNVDAIAGGYINHEYVLLEKEGHDIEIFNPSDFGVPNMYELVFAAGEDTFNKKKQTIEKFWQAVTKGQQFVKENADEGLNILLANENADSTLDPEVEKESLEILLPLMEEENVPFGYQEESSWQATIDWLLETGVIREKVNPADFVKNVAVKQ